MQPNSCIPQSLDNQPSLTIRHINYVLMYCMKMVGAEGQKLLQGHPRRAPSGVI